jgi:3-oxoacyl-[acyl-carrier protein] reductase
MKAHLTGKVAIVTGSGRGIGRGIAIGLAKEGAKVVVNDVDKEPAEETAKLVREAGGEAAVCACGVDKRDQAQTIIDTAISNFGRVDILVNNAGIIRDAMMVKMTEEQFDSVVGVWNCTQAAAKHLIEQKSGKIINIISLAGVTGNIGQANYSAAKAAMIGLTKSNAKEFARYGINVNAIGPAAFTRMVEAIPEQIREVMAKRIPLGRFGTPEDIAPAVIFLASEDSNYITGQVLHVDGGMSLAF